MNDTTQSIRFSGDKFIFKHGAWISYDEELKFTKHSAADAHIAAVPQGSPMFIAGGMQIWTSVDEGIYLGDSTTAVKYQILGVNSTLTYLPYNSNNMGTSYTMENQGAVLTDGFRVRLDGVYAAANAQQYVLIEDVVFERTGNTWVLVE